VSTIKEHDALIEAARRSENQRDRFNENTTGGRRAREILAGLAEHCRVAAAALLTDPTLATEPFSTGRFRSVDLLTELSRQLTSLVRQAELDDCGRARWPRERRWEEAEALFVRFVELAKAVPTVVPRPDHATIAGSRAISTARLAARHSELTEAAMAIESAVAAALTLPHPDPRALELAELAARLHRTAVSLDVEHDTSRAELEIALRLAPSWRPRAAAPAPPETRTGERR
jgi:hypothetical protein